MEANKHVENLERNNFKFHFLRFLTCEYVLVFFLAILGVLLRGYTYRGTFMLPYSYQFLDPTLFSRDIAFFSYDLNFFFLINAYLSKVISYETMFFVGYLISSFLLALGVYLLATTLFQKKEIGYMAVLLTLFVKPAISAMTTIWTYYYYKDLAMGIILISLALFLKKRYVWSFIMLGVASLLHILFSLYFVAFYGLFFVVTLFSPKMAAIRSITPIDRRRMLFGFFILTLFISSPIYLILSSEQQVNSASDMETWFQILKMRSFDHFFPSTWITNSVVVFIPLLILFLIYLFSLYAKKKFLSDTYGEENRGMFRLEVALYFVVCIILGVMAVVFSEVIPVRMLTILQLFRPTIMLTIFGILFGAFVIYWLYTEAKKQSRRDYLFLVFLLFVSLFWYDFRLLYMAVGLLGVYVFEISVSGCGRIYVVRRLVEWGIGLVLILGIISFVFPSFLYVSYVGEQIFRFQDTTYVFLLLGGIVFIIDFVLCKKVIERYLPLATGLFLVVGVFSSGVIAVRESTIHSDDPCYTPRSQFDFFEHLQYPAYPVTEHMGVALWAKGNTPKDALFLISPECGSDFRNFGERSVFMDFKYGTMSTFSVKFGLEWWERVKAINPNREEYDYHTFYRNLVEDYGAMEEEQVSKLALKYELDYAVFRIGKNFSFPVAYENSEYVVYDVQQIEE